MREIAEKKDYKEVFKVRQKEAKSQLKDAKASLRSSKAALKKEELALKKAGVEDYPRITEELMRLESEIAVVGKTIHELESSFYLKYSVVSKIEPYLLPDGRIVNLKILTDFIRKIKRVQRTTISIDENVLTLKYRTSYSGGELTLSVEHIPELENLAGIPEYGQFLLD